MSNRDDWATPDDGPLVRLENLLFLWHKYHEAPIHNDARHGYRFGIAYRDLAREFELSEVYLRERSDMIIDKAAQQKCLKRLIDNPLSTDSMVRIKAALDTVKERRARENHDDI